MCEGTKFIKTVRHYNIDYQISEHDFHNQNSAEGVIRELRKKWFITMIRTKCTKQLWDYGMYWCSEVMPLTHSTAGSINGVVLLEQLTGDTPDISEYLDFGFYNKVWYKYNSGLGELLPGRWLGVSSQTGRLMCYHVLTQTESVISSSTVQWVTNLE